jgi:hypothetical protein
MRDPWIPDETWTADDLEVSGTHEDCEAFPVAYFEGTAMGPDKARLAAAAPDMARLMLEIVRSFEEGCSAGEVGDMLASRLELPDGIVGVLRKAGVLP